nr:expressed protein [Hymenolepis microstoma]
MYQDCYKDHLNNELCILGLGMGGLGAILLMGLCIVIIRIKVTEQRNERIIAQLEAVKIGTEPAEYKPKPPKNNEEQNPPPSIPSGGVTRSEDVNSNETKRQIIAPQKDILESPSGRTPEVAEKSTIQNSSTETPGGSNTKANDTTKITPPAVVPETNLNSTETPLYPPLPTDGAPNSDLPYTRPAPPIIKAPSTEQRLNSIFKSPDSTLSESTSSPDAPKDTLDQETSTNDGE